MYCVDFVVLFFFKKKVCGENKLKKKKSERKVKFTQKEVEQKGEKKKVLVSQSNSFQKLFQIIKNER